MSNNIRAEAAVDVPKGNVNEFKLEKPAFHVAAIELHSVLLLY